MSHSGDGDSTRNDAPTGMEALLQWNSPVAERELQVGARAQQSTSPRHGRPLRSKRPVWPDDQTRDSIPRETDTRRQRFPPRRSYALCNQIAKAILCKCNESVNSPSHSRVDARIRHSRAGGNPALSRRSLDSRLRGNDGGEARLSDKSAVTRQAVATDQDLGHIAHACQQLQCRLGQVEIV